MKLNNPISECRIGSFMNALGRHFATVLACLSLGALLALPVASQAFTGTEGDDTLDLTAPEDITEDADALGEEVADTLNVTGEGTSTFNFTDFELMNFDALEWTFEGVLDVGEATISSGTLLLSRGIPDGDPETEDGDINIGLIGNVTVLEGATLGGTATIRGNVTNGGIISPGLSIGTLIVDGTVLFQNTSELLIEIDVDADPSGDRLTSTGNITIEGGDLHIEWVDLADAEDNFSATTLMNASNIDPETGVNSALITGTFTSATISQSGDPVVSEDPLVTEINFVAADGCGATGCEFETMDLELDGVLNSARPLIVYGDSGVFAWWLRDVGGHATDIDGNDLQINIGNAVQSMRDQGSTNLLNVVDRLTVLAALSPQSYLPALDALDGGEHLTLLHTQRMAEQRFVSEISDQLRGPTNGLSAFFRGYWASQSVSDDKFAQGLSGNAIGVVGGISGQIGPYIQVGAAAGYESASLKFDDDLAEADTTTFQAGAFVHVQDRTGLFGTILVSYADHSNDVTRGYAIGNEFATPVSDYDSDGKSIYLDVGKTIKLDKGSFIIPHASILYGKNNRDAVTEGETAAPTISLEKASATSILGYIGVDSWFRLDLGIPLAFEFEGGVQYEFGDRRLKALTILHSEDTSSSAYLTQGARPNAHALKFAASVQGAFMRGLLWKVRYDGQFGDLSSHAGILSLNITNDIF